MGREDGDGDCRELECGWKPRVICKIYAEELPKMVWIEAVWQELREGNHGGERVLAGWMRRAALGAGGVYVGTGTALFKGNWLPWEVASLFLPPHFQGRGEAGPVPASWKCH